jgi:hypothetical protein
MNIFLACFLAVIFARVVLVAGSLTAQRFVTWRMRRVSHLAQVSPLVGEADPQLAMAWNEARVQAEAESAITLAADAYALAPGQGTLDQLCEAAAAFGKAQTPRSRELRLRIAEMRARHGMPRP